MSLFAFTLTGPQLLAAAGGLGVAAWWCLRRLDRRFNDRFHLRLLRQASVWLAEQWRIPADELYAALQMCGEQGSPAPRRLDDLLRIEFEAADHDGRECVLRVHVAIWCDGGVQVGTISSRCELESLPAYVRRRLLTRYDEPASFELWNRETASGAEDAKREGAAT